MFCKLSKNCLEFEAKGIPMLGDPNSGYLLGLSEEGKRLVSKLSVGCDINVEELTSEEIALFRAIKQQGFLEGTPPVELPRVAYLHVTNRCNMNCIGCYSGALRNNHAQDPLQLDDVKRIVDNLAAAKVSSVIVSGGEPFLRKDIIDILQYIKQVKKIKSVTCITNGTAKYQEYRRGADTVDHLAFSMDGYSKESSFLRGAVFEKTVDAIRQLKEDGYRPSIIFTLHHKNSRYVHEMRAMAESLGASYNFSLFTVSSTSETADLEVCIDDIDFLIQHGDISVSDTPTDGEFGCRVCCGAGRSLISICGNGDVMPCHMFTDKEFCMGNALKDDIASIFEQNDRPLVHVDSKKECVNCEFKYICGGGCPARAYLQNNDLKSVDPVCRLHKETILSTLRYLTK